MSPLGLHSMTFEGWPIRDAQSGGQCEYCAKVIGRLLIEVGGRRFWIPVDTEDRRRRHRCNR